MDCLALHRLLLHPLGTAGVPEPLGEGVVVDLQLRHFLVLICCHCDELALLEHVGPEGGVGELEDVAGPDQVEPRLVLVHRVQDRLDKGERPDTFIIIISPHKVSEEIQENAQLLHRLENCLGTTKADKLGRKIGHNFP